MFKRARLKLTGWYLLILMVITGSFSLLVYQNLSEEVNRSYRVYNYRVQQFQILDPDFPFVPQSDQQLLDEVRRTIGLRLLLIDGIILAVAGAASYFLAGLTLNPIEIMVEDQKRFVSDASHELRTPLTALRTEIEVAAREKHLTIKEAKELLVSNLEEVSKMQALTNYLLALNRYQKDSQKEMLMSRVNLKDVAEKAVAKVTTKAEENKIELVTEANDATVKGNAMSLEELIIIFVDNAIKYSHKGGKVWLTVGHDHTNGLVTIKDEGVGISKEDIPHIFDRFYRADLSRSKINTDGYGLGLSIAKNIIEMHHGRVEVESEIDKGTTFRIFLPT